MASISINELSLTISELVDLNPDQQSLLTAAVDRAISVNDIVGGRSKPCPIIAGGIRPFPIGKILPPTC
jgi:hypothetical protein